MLRKFFQTAAVLGLVGVFMAGCASSQMKARKDQREKVSQTSKLYCDFVNGDVYPDVEVQLNLEMAKRCDSDKSFTATSYRTTNENLGIVYCCALHDETVKPQAVPSAEVKKPAVDAKKPETKSDAKKTGAAGADELGN
jgi:hypothetical protein